MSPKAEQDSAAAFALQLDGDEEESYSSFSFIEITDEELAAETGAELEPSLGDHPLAAATGPEAAPPPAEPAAARSADESSLPAEAPPDEEDRSREHRRPPTWVVAAVAILVGLGILGLVLVS